MKLVAATASLIAGLVIAVIVTGSCSVNHRSGEFTECERPADCANGQTCIEGVCQAPGGGDDAGPGDDGDVKPDALVCPSQCTSCRLETMECRVDCAVSPPTCNIKITCPPGWNCNISCSGQNSCRQGIDCTQGESCTINCSGTQSCRGIQCGEGPCRTTCSGEQSCRGIQCGESCRCDVDCQVFSACEEVACSAEACELPVKGCSSLRPECNTCE